MSPYRVAPPKPPSVRCAVCGLELVRLEPPRGLSFAGETIFVLAHPPAHGGGPCPGPPRVQFVPWWRFVWEWLGGV